MLEYLILENYRELRNWYEISNASITFVTEKELVSTLKELLSNSKTLSVIGSINANWLSLISDICPNHAYSVSDYNPFDESARLINPNNTAVYNIENIEIFPIYFDTVYVKQL